MAKTKIENESVGRPTKYKKEFNSLAFRYCLLGATDVDLAKAFEVDESTINNWKIKHPEFLESIYAGKEKADMKVVGELYKGAQDRVVKEQQAFKVKKVFWDSEGRRCEEEELQVIDVERVIPADFRNQQFWLKNRRPEKWRDRQDIDHTTNGKEINNNPLVFVSASELKAEELDGLIKAQIRGSEVDADSSNDTGS